MYLFCFFSVFQSEAKSLSNISTVGWISHNAHWPFSLSYIQMIPTWYTRFMAHIPWLKQHSGHLSTHQRHSAGLSDSLGDRALKTTPNLLTQEKVKTQKSNTSMRTSWMLSEVSSSSLLCPETNTLMRHICLGLVYQTYVWQNFGVGIPLTAQYFSRFSNYLLP